jgi:hypothetical protein
VDDDVSRLVRVAQILIHTHLYLNVQQANKDVWNGWTWWAAGPWWGNYIYLLEPNSDGTDPNRLMANLQNYF